MDQFSIERKKLAQEVGTASNFGRNTNICPGRLVRQRSLSGHGNESKKWLLSKNPDWLTKIEDNPPFFFKSLCSVDEIVATPSFNVSVIESACDQDFKFFDAINKSKYVAYIDSALTGLGLFAISIGIYVIKYCKLREIERNSNYFYFSRLFKTCNAEEIKNKMGEIVQDNGSTDDPITYEYLQAAAYFYPPDISKFACWRRRFFASGKEKKKLKALNNFLGINPEKTLNTLHKKTTEKVCQLLNTEANKFKTSSYENTEVITLSDTYAVNFFDHVKDLFNHNVETAINKIKGKTIKIYISPILAALGQASFIYWILLFIFCFIPMAPVVTAAAISVIPLAIALCGALPLLLIFKIKNTYQAYNDQKQLTEEMIKEQHEQMLKNKLVALNKQKVFLDCLKNKNANSTIELKNSPLMKDLDRVLKRRRFSKYHAICMGFLDGCFLPLFAGWLLLDGAKVILTYVLCPAIIPLTSFTPIGLIATAIITGITLLIGVSYGIYSAYRANRAHKAKFDDLEVKINALKEEVPTKEVLNKSLQDYDRLLRRFSDEQPLWTNTKKGLNRFLIIIKRLGTGSLVFRLIIWGPITAVVAASMTVIPTFFPIILIVGTAVGAFVLASYYLYAYNLESKTGQAGRIVEHLVQSEQLACVDTQLPPLPEESLSTYELTSENLIVVPKKLADCRKNREKTSSDTASSNSTEIGAMTTLNETGMQKNTSHSSLNGLFQNTQDIANEGKNLGESSDTAILVKKMS